jgi:hypothetical protein
VKFLVPTLLLILCLGCDSQQVAGSGSQTGNSVVAGRILPSDSISNPANLRVFLRPLGWTTGDKAAPGALDSTLTDSAGFYRFESVPSDTYRVEVAAQRFGWSRTVRARGDSTVLPSVRLSKWGRLLVEIEVTDTIEGGYLEFYGLNRMRILPRTSGEFQFLIDSLPVGLQTVRIYLPSLSRMFCEAPVRIGADSTSKVEYEGWDRDGKGPREDQ